MDVTWSCTACGKSKQLHSVPQQSRKTSVTSDCWPCGRKRVFKPNAPRGSSTAGGGTTEDNAAMPRALSNNTDETAKAKGGGGSTTPSVSPRTAPTSSTAMFPGPSSEGTATKTAAAAAFQAWATSKVGAGGPRATVTGGSSTTTTAPIPSAPGAFATTSTAAVAARETSSPEQRPSVVGRVSGGPFATSSSSTREEVPSGPVTSAFAPQFRLPSPATGRSPRDSVSTQQQRQNSHSRTRSASTGGSGPLARTSGTLISALTQGDATAAGGSFSPQIICQQQPPRWLCSSCGKEKNLGGPHLKGKSTVRSDCWPCGRKRVFELRHRNGSGNVAAAAAISEPPSNGSAEAATLPQMDARSSQLTPPLVTSSFGNAAAVPAPGGGFALNQTASGAASASAPDANNAPVDLDAYLRNVFAYMHRDLAAARSRSINLRGCPAPEGTTQPLPTLQLVERSELWAAGEGPASLARQASGSSGMGSRTASAADDRADTFERLAAISARIGPSLTRAAAASQLPKSGDDGPAVSIGVFCNSHDELAATAAYFALAAGDVRRQNNVVYHVFGPPPEYTTNRTPASDLLTALRRRFGDGVVTLTPPITHDERHRAVKYIAKRSGSVMVAPSGAVGFAVAERAHQLWHSQGVSWPALSLVLLGRPARWGEIERVLKIVEALKIKDRAPMSPVMPDGAPLSMDESF